MITPMPKGMVVLRQRGPNRRCGDDVLKRSQKTTKRSWGQSCLLPATAAVGVLVFMNLALAECGQSGRRSLGGGVYKSHTGLGPPFENESSQCPIAFHEIGGKCYFYGYFKLNWFRAMEFCHSFGQSVSLTCIETNEENNHLKEWLEKNGDHSTGVWVGGSDNGHDGKWAWFPTGQLIRQFNWGPSQPSGGDQHCMYIVGGFMGYQWADFHCAFEMTFLCEYEVNTQMAWRKRRMDTTHRSTDNGTHQSANFLSELSNHIQSFQAEEKEVQEFSTFPSLSLDTTSKVEVITSAVDKKPVYITPLSKLANIMVTSRSPVGLQRRPQSPIRPQSPRRPPIPILVSSGTIHHQNSIVISPPAPPTTKPKHSPNSIYSFKDKHTHLSNTLSPKKPMDADTLRIYDSIRQKILLG